MREYRECRAGRISAKANVGIESSGQIGVELPGVREGGMPGRNVQRKLGTTRGSPRRSRTAKTSRISRRAVKSRCACEWGGWGRLSDDGPGQHNLDPSEGPWGGGYPNHHGGALSSPRPGAVRENRSGHEVQERRKQTRCWMVHAGSRLKPKTLWEGAARKASPPAVPGKTRRTCVKKMRERHAVWEMKEGPSESPCRGRLQTATSCSGQNPWW